jgi:hypothetical protein
MAAGLVHLGGEEEVLAEQFNQVRVGSDGIRRPALHQAKKVSVFIAGPVAVGQLAGKRETGAFARIHHSPAEFVADGDGVLLEFRHFDPYGFFVVVDADIGAADAGGDHFDFDVVRMQNFWDRFFN